MTVHSDKEGYKCPCCKKTCRWQHNLKRHFQVHYKTEKELEKAWKKYSESVREAEPELNLELSAAKEIPEASSENEHVDNMTASESSDSESVSSSGNLDSRDGAPGKNRVNTPVELELSEDENFDNEKPNDMDLETKPTTSSIRPRGFQCEVCDETMKNAWNLRNHMKTHKGEMPFECEICQKKFPEVAKLQQHMKVHSDKIDHKCPCCEKTYRFGVNMKRHFRVHYKAKEELEEAWKKYMESLNEMKRKLKTSVATRNCEAHSKQITMRESSKEEEEDSEKDESYEGSDVKATNRDEQFTSPEPVCCDLKDLRYNVCNKYCIHQTGCQIPPGAEYMHPRVGPMKHENFYCLPCFRIKYPDETKTYGYVKSLNQNPNFEEIIECTKCGEQWHRCCALHLEEDSFVCIKCGESEVSMTLDKRHVEYCNSSRFMKERANQFLKKLIGEEAATQCPISIATFTELASGITKKLVPKVYHEEFLKKYSKMIYYRTRAIYVFQRIDDVDVLFFVMYTQEYENYQFDGSSWFVIDFLDTVPYFQPMEHKGTMYSHLILSYMDYMKSIGFRNGHIWSNPPGQGEDYVFNVHPDSQVYLDSSRLEKWYKNVFGKGKKEGIIEKYETFGERNLYAKVTKPTDLPVFLDSLWSKILLESAPYRRKNQKMKKTKFTDVLKRDFEDHDSDNFFIRLSPTSEAMEDDPGTYEDEILGNRGDFQLKCQEENWEFSSLRRAKFASIAIINQLIEKK